MPSGPSYPVSGNTGPDTRVPKDDLKKSVTEVWRNRSRLLLQNLLTTSKHPHNSLSSCCCSLLVPYIVLEHPGASFKSVQATQPNSKPSWRFKLRFLSFFKGVLFQKFKSVVERELLVMGVQRLEDIFSIVSTNLRSCRGSESRWRKYVTT